MEHSPDTEPMRGARRIDGQKYHVEKLTDEELDGIYGHLTARHCKIVADLAFVESVMLDRLQPSLPFDEEPYIEGYGEIADNL